MSHLRRPLLVVATTLLLPLIATAATAAAPPSAPTRTTVTKNPAPISATTAAARTLVASALRDADAATWVHQDSTTAYTGVLSATSNATIGSAGSYGTYSTTGLLGNSTLSVTTLSAAQQMYVEGNAPALVNLDSTTFTPDVAPSYANEWIELTPATSNSNETTDYEGYADSSLKDTFSQVSFAGRLTLSAPLTYAGHRARAITGKLTNVGITGTLYVTNTARPLPLAIKANEYGETLSVSWTAWNAGTLPPAPTMSVPFPSAPTTTTTTTSPVTTSTLPAAANFCADVATSSPSSGSSTSTSPTTRAGLIRYIDATLADAPAAYTQIEATIAASPTPDIAAAFTQELSATHSLIYVFTELKVAAEKLPATATAKQVNALLSGYGSALFIVVYILTDELSPVSASISAYCPSLAPTTTTTTP